MNRPIIKFILGCVLKIEGVLLLLPCLVSIIYQEKVGFYYLCVASGAVLVGFLMSRKKPKDYVFFLKEGCVATSLSWILLSIVGCLPFYISGEIPSFTDALFETISGFTTTGASVLSDVEALSHCALFWRSFTHWIGGMGVLVFLLAIIPLSGGSHFNLMRAESPGPSVGKMVPTVKYTARILYLIYIGMTLLQIVLMLAGGCAFFDSLTISFGTAGTGGFGIYNDSLASYSPYIQWVTAVFMVLFGINFNMYYLILYRKFRKAFHMEEVKVYIGIILVSIGIVFFQILRISGSVFQALRDSTFQVASIITTTGFSTVDFNLWSQSSKAVLVLLMIIGACAGSTGGGIKVSRIVILVKTLIKELNSYIHPRSIKKIKFEGKPIEHEVVRSTNVYLITYVLIFAISVLLLCFEGKDLVTNFTAVAATFNNIGPGLEMVGPTQNFGVFLPGSKFILMFDMLAGRLELFPLLLLFHPVILKEAFHRKNKKREKKQ